MRILAIDIGTGTQDILLFDSSMAVENCVKIIAPSPTVVVANRVRRATARGRNLLLTGVTMGGGPCAWAVADHLRAGLAVFATPDAARTFNDDLDEVRQMGVQIVADARDVPDAARAMTIALKDVDLAALERAFSSLDVPVHYDAIAIAVQDHGAAPPGVSDRLFRFEYLKRVVEKENGLVSFAYLADQLPPELTRMRAVAQTLGDDHPALLLDTGPAAALGALEDATLAEHPDRVVVNVGNLHTLAFHLRGEQILGFFEHHTGQITEQRLDALVKKLIAGTLTHEDVFGDHGHGAVVLATGARAPFLAVTGPRRGLMAGSRLRPYFAVPCGDMMLAGCFGLVRAFARKIPEWHDEIANALLGNVGGDRVASA